MSVPAEAVAVDRLVARARAAQTAFAYGADQERYDRAAKAAAWALLKPERNRALAALAVESTGLGNVADKIRKNHRKTLGLLRDISSARTCGIVSDDPDAGVTEIARPVGVVGAVVPSTNPVATPTNNIVNAVKCGNAIVLAPSPKGAPACRALLEQVHAEFRKARLDPVLVQMIPEPATKAATQRLLEAADLVVATGSQDNVRRAYSSGTPAIGVGAGNVPVIVDETADLAAAAAMIAASKTFDNATSCSSENSIIAVDSIYDEFADALRIEGAAILDPALEELVVDRLWPGGRLNRRAVAKDAATLIEALGLDGRVSPGARFLAVPTRGVGPDHPLSGEKLSLVAALYRTADFDEAATVASRILAHHGAGHSVGVHTADDGRAIRLGLELPACRVIVNQPHCFATGGSFDNALPFSLSMGCGSWGGNSIDENLHWRHFLNITRVVRRIPENRPEMEEIFAGYWAEFGR